MISDKNRMIKTTSPNSSFEIPVSVENFEKECLSLKDLIVKETEKINNTYIFNETKLELEYMFNIKQLIVSQEKYLRKNIMYLRRTAVKKFYDVKGKLVMKDLRTRNQMISRLSILDRQLLCKCIMNKYQSESFQSTDLNDISPLQISTDTSFDYNMTSKIINSQISPISRYFEGCEYCKPEKLTEPIEELFVSPFLSSSDSDDDYGWTLHNSNLQDFKKSDIYLSKVSESYNSDSSIKSRVSKKKISFNSADRIWEFDTDEPDRQFFFRDMTTRIHENYTKQVLQQTLFGFDSTDFFSWDRAEMYINFF